MGVMGYLEMNGSMYYQAIVVARFRSLHLLVMRLRFLRLLEERHRSSLPYFDDAFSFLPVFSALRALFFFCRIYNCYVPVYSSRFLRPAGRSR